MVVLIVVFLLSIGAIAAFLLPPQHRVSHIAVSLVPVAALAVLLLRLPIPDSFAVSWSPMILFPEPLAFRAGPQSVPFAVYLCCLLILIEWTRPTRRSPGRSARVATYLLAISGIAACFASSPLAVIIVWAWIDFTSFLVVFLPEKPRGDHSGRDFLLALPRQRNPRRQPVGVQPGDVFDLYRFARSPFRLEFHRKRIPRRSCADPFHDGDRLSPACRPAAIHFSAD
jgi:hypothetical protein